MFEADLQESEEKFRTIAEITPLGMILVNQENIIIYMNPQLTRTLGYTQEEVPDIQTALLVLFPDPTDREEARSRWQEQAWFLRKTEPGVRTSSFSDVCQGWFTENS